MVQPPPGPPQATPPGGIQPPPPLPVRSGAVNAVAIVNFVLGGLNLLGGFAALFCGWIFAAVLGAAASESDAQSAGTATAVVGAFATVVAIVIMAMGIPMLVAGFGVHKRAQWGRILTLVLGGFAAVFAVINLMSFNIFGVVTEGGYCAMAFMILLKPEYAAEFH